MFMYVKHCLFVYTCLALFTRACIPMFSHVYSCLTMFTPVYLLYFFNCVYLCLVVFAYVYHVSLCMFTYSYPRLLMFTDVCYCLTVLVYLCLPKFTRVNVR